MNIEKIYERCIKDKIEINQKEIEDIINSIDMEKLRQEISNNYKLVIWDKKSSINNIKPKDIIKSRSYSIDSAYMIYINEKLTYFQDYKPNVEGFISMTNKEAEDLGNEFMNKIIDNNVEEQIYNIIQTYIKRKE